ncbi:MAG: hypothetical protein DMF89_15305 [Acidobacteria bacterium]|nr:MAG: hypothetical protein DMF89_15305 [Acidobacteriota bacterium]
MLRAGTSWTKLGPILTPDPGREWMATYTGASFAMPRPDAGVVDVYVTGRDSSNRSRIGMMMIDPERPAPPLAIADAPSLDIGTLGAFDENGVSYPWIVRAEDGLHMYYVGWMPTLLTPFQNHIGLAVKKNGGEWRRYSRAPLLPRTDEEYLSLGSTSVVREKDRWRMWYTCFRSWGQGPRQPKHVYTRILDRASFRASTRRPVSHVVQLQGPALPHWVRMVRRWDPLDASRRPRWHRCVAFGMGQRIDLL